MKLLRKTKNRPLGSLLLTRHGACAIPAPKMTVRVGCRLVYETNHGASIFLVVRPRPENEQIILQERLTFRCDDGAEQFQDAQGNITHRWILHPGQTTIVHDALVEVSSLADDFNQKKFSVPIKEISSAILRYTLPSRYCDS